MAAGTLNRWPLAPSRLLVASAAFAADGLAIDGQRGAHLLVRLAQSGVAVLCGQNTWTLLVGHVPHPRRLEREAALAELARRYADYLELALALAD